MMQVVKPHTVYVLDDHDIVRYGLSALVHTCDKLQLVGAGETLEHGLRDIARLRPDLVISDMSLSDSKGLETVKAVVEAQQGRPVLVVTMHEQEVFGEQVLALGARGYLMKESASQFCIPAALQVLDGGVWISPALNAQILGRLLKRNMSTSGQARPAELLSSRELQVFTELGSGKTTKEIARKLNLSARTVDIHRSSIKRKLGLRTSAELIAYSVSQT